MSTFITMILSTCVSISVKIKFCYKRFVKCVVSMTRTQFSEIKFFTLQRVDIIVLSPGQYCDETS